MALLGQLFTPEELARDLKFHELSPQERELILLAIADELRQADQKPTGSQVRADMRARILQLFALLRPSAP
jgi:hypothetical protein